MVWFGECRPVLIDTPFRNPPGNRVGSHLLRRKWGEKRGDPVDGERIRQPLVATIRRNNDRHALFLIMNACQEGIGFGGQDGKRGNHLPCLVICPMGIQSRKTKKRMLLEIDVMRILLFVEQHPLKKTGSRYEATEMLRRLSKRGLLEYRFRTGIEGFRPNRLGISGCFGKNASGRLGRALVGASVSC